MKTLTFGLIFLLILASVTYPFEVKVEPAVGPTAYVKWVAASMPIKFFIDSKGSADVSFAQASDAVKKSFTTWQSVTGQTLKFSFAGVKTGTVVSTTDQTNVVIWIESNWPSSSFILAVTKTSYLIQNPPNFVDADILINGVNFQWTTTAAAGKADIQSTIQHEVGHLIGLQHSQLKNAKMLPSGSISKILSVDELTGIRFLYPPAPISEFKILSPFNGAILLGGPNPASLGFPLATYRWSTPTGFSNFTVEFSSVNTFSPASKVKSFARGASDSLTETSTVRTQLQNLSGTAKKLFWRVKADSASGKKTTAVASFTFE